jgi:ribokinase
VRILVSGLINVETTVKVDGFPIHYSPVNYPFYGIHSTVSGVGYNLTRALTRLGDQVTLAALVGSDPGGRLALDTLAQDQISAELVLPRLVQTPQSVILYDPKGQRQIHVDLKDIQEQLYPAEVFDRAVKPAALAVLCNINFSRLFLRRALQAGKRIATDVHAIASLEDEYNRDFMASAEILFMSDERLPTPPIDWARQLLNRYGAEIIVIGLGSRGAVLAVRRDQYIERFPAVFTRPVVNTIGAGDALFAGFLHFYLASGDPYESLRKAMVFASYKIGTTGGAEGYLEEGALNKLYQQALPPYTSPRSRNAGEE